MCVPRTHTQPPLPSIRHQSTTSVTVDEPTRAQHDHPASMVYIRVHSLCCPFHEFGQTYNDTYPPVKYHTEYFHCPKNPIFRMNMLCLLFHSFIFRASGFPLISLYVM